MAKKNLGFANLVLEVGRQDTSTGTSSNKRVGLTILEFVESEWGLNFKLFPVQRVILKIYYGLELDDVDPYIEIADWRKEDFTYYTEWGYFNYLWEKGRCNVNPKDYVVGFERQELILPIGRRSGKTTISSCIAAYEAYRLILKGSPQGYYGIPSSNTIQLISIATDKEQAGLLFQEVSGHFQGCQFFHNYIANNTQSYVRLQTPKDIERHGSYKEDNTAKATIKVTFRSCIAKGLRGAGNIVIILDEVAHFTDEGQSSAESVWNAVRPSASAFSPKDPKNKHKPIGDIESKIVLISSPLGKDGLFYDRYRLGMMGGVAGRNLLCIQAPTWEVNPTIPAVEFETNYASNAATFFVEYGAEFSDRARGWIEQEDDLMNCVQPGRRMVLSAPPRVPHYIGIDFALVGDASAVAIGHLENSQIILDLSDQIRAGLGRFSHKTRLEFEDVVEWITDLSRKFYFKKGMFDQWCGVIFEQMLHNKGLRQIEMQVMTASLNSQIFRTFKDLMWQKRLVLPEAPEKKEGEPTYLEELLTLQASMDSKYIITVEAPKSDGKHDDRSDALARMIWLASQDLGSAHATLTNSTPSNYPRQQKASRHSRIKALRSGSDPKRMVWRGNRLR